MKGFLSQAGVPFTVRDVDEDPSAYDELIAAGFRSVPVTLLGGESVKGFDAPALQAAIERARTAGEPGA